MEEAVNTGLTNTWAYVGMEKAVNIGLTNTWAYVEKEDAEMMNMDGIGLSLAVIVTPVMKNML